MAREATITQEQVNAAAEAMVGVGQKPTNRAILDKLGSGSMATVVKLLQNWKAGQVRASTAIDDVVDPDVAKAIGNMLARKITEATVEANAKLVDLQTDLASVISENERQIDTIQEQSEEIAQLRAQVQSQSGQIEQLKVDATSMRAQLASEVKTRESAQIALGKAELRIESIPTLMEDLKQARAEAKGAGQEAAELRQQQAEALADAGEIQPPVKTFKDYEPGFLHMDIKYLPQMPDEKERRYLFVAIDRATRWVFMHIYADQSERSSVDFLNRLERAAPMKIVKLLTDNGSQFTDRFTSKKREPTGRHVFDLRCAALNIEHRLCPPRHPQTNGMVERFNGRISEVVSQTRFASAAELETTLERYVKTYNQQIPQRALDHRSPVQALKEWQNKKPELFKKRVYNQAGLDT
ncbi:Integrase core domain [Achromobacter sp. 2789STDY5608633]|nr:Integrase core domain [Achromobacter sp. 2789STDY5608633]